MCDKDEKWSSMKEICEHLGIGRDTVIKWITEKDMPAVKIGRLWKFKISEVDLWLKQNSNKKQSLDS